MNMPIELKKEFKILAVREGKSMKDIIIEVLGEYVKIHKDGNPQHLITNFSENEDFKGFPSMGIDYNKKKQYTKKFLQKDGRLNKLGQELWGHTNQWFKELQKY